MWRRSRAGIVNTTMKKRVIARLECRLSEGFLGLEVAGMAIVGGGVFLINGYLQGKGCL